MYKTNKMWTTTLSVNNSYQGERIEQKMERILNNKEPIKDSSPLIYTERKDGIKAETDIRTDRWEIAVEAMDKVSRTLRARRENKPNLGKEAQEGMKREENTGGESIQATGSEQQPT